MSIHLPSNRSVEDWQLAVWNADDAVLTRPQKLVLMLMLDASFNSFDAFRVVRDLLANREKWEGVVMCRGFPAPSSQHANYHHLHGDLIDLRDVASGHWNVDTVYLLHRPERTATLTALAKTWSADEIHTYDGDAACSLLGAYGTGGPAILRVWWD